MTHIEQRYGTASEWAAANPTLNMGEVGWETNTRKSKLGDGVTHWNDLSYTVASVVVTKADVDLSHVDDTSDLDKPISDATQAALDLKASKDSPAFTGNPTAPTPDSADNDTTIATTAFVRTATQSLAPKDSPVFVGNPTAPTPDPAENDTTLATTAFVHTLVDAKADPLPDTNGRVDIKPSVTVGTSAGWLVANVTVATYQKRSGILDVAIQMTSPALDTTANSNYANQVILTLPVAARPPMTRAFTGRWDDVPISGEINTAGQVIIRGGVPRAFASGDLVVIQMMCFA